MEWAASGQARGTCAGELQRPLPRRRRARPRGRRLVPDARAACPSAGTASGSSCASTPPPIVRSYGSTGRRSPSTRAATRRSRRMSPIRSSSEPRTASPWWWTTRCHWQSIPPGYVEETPDGRRQKYFHDFFNYAGLHRSVWLYTRPRSHVDDVTVITDLDGSTGTVDYEVRVTRGRGPRGARRTPRRRRCRGGTRPR